MALARAGAPSVARATPISHAARRSPPRPPRDGLRRARQRPSCAAPPAPAPESAALSRAAALRRDGGLGVVLTGGTKGIGFCLAKELLGAGDRVLLCARDGARLAAALDALRPVAAAGGGKVQGVVADVGVAEHVDALERAAWEFLGEGGVHLVINNAGAASRRRLPLAELDADDILNTVNVNVSGGFLVLRMALRLFFRQPAVGEPLYHYFSFGFSAAGSQLSASALTHKVTKLSLPVLDDFARKELAKTEHAQCVGLHQCSPGLVLTELLLADTTPGVRAFIFNALAEEPQDVAAALAPRLRQEGTLTARVELLSLPQAAARMASTVPRVLLGDQSAMRFFNREGERIGCGKYRDNGVEELFRGM